MAEGFIYGQSGEKNNHALTTNGLIFQLADVNFQNYNDSSRGDIGYATTLGLPIGIAERTLEIVNQCGTADNFIFSYGGNTASAGSTFSITQTEFVGYNNTVQYATFSNVKNTLRHIVITSYDKNMNIYVNGELVKNATLSYSCSPDDTVVSLNRWRQNSVISTTGCVLYDLRYYNRILTPNEVKNNFNIFSTKYDFGQ